jgi:hypothetical protein
MNKILLIIIVIFSSSCFFSGGIAVNDFGVKKNKLYKVKEGVYIHKNFNILATRDEYVGDHLVRDNVDYMVVPVGSFVSVTGFKTSGKWPMTSLTQVIGNIEIRGKVHHNVIISSLFYDYVEGHDTSKYVESVESED